MINKTMNKHERKTYGQLLHDRQFAEQIRLADSYEFAKQVMKGMIDDVNAEIAEHAQGKYKGKSFYVLALIATEALGKAPKTIVTSTFDCPYPSLNQTVWKVDHLKEEAFLLWTLPGKPEANEILNYPNRYLKNNPHSQETMDYVFKLKSGALKELSDKENGYKKDMALIIQEA